MIKRGGGEEEDDDERTDECLVLTGTLFSHSNSYHIALKLLPLQVAGLM
jgi:hypothetical protein